MAAQPVWLEVALLSGRTETIHAEAGTYVRQLKLDAGQLLHVSIATLSRTDGTLLEEMLTIEEAQLQPGEVLQATAANVRVEMEGEALRLLKLLDTDEPATINDCVYQVADLEVEGPEELEHLFQLILTKALSTPQAAAACTDMMCGLRERYAGAFEEEGQRPVKSTRLLLNVVQFNYEKLFDPDSIAQQKRNWWSGWMQVFGHLLMRRLIAARVVGQVVHEMIGIKEETPEKLPEEGMMQCTCELFELCGEFLDQTHHNLMENMFGRLTRLAAEKHSPGAENSLDSCAVYSPEIRRRVESLVHLRDAGWNNMFFAGPRLRALLGL